MFRQAVDSGLESVTGQLRSKLNPRLGPYSEEEKRLREDALSAAAAGLVPLAWMGAALTSVSLPSQKLREDEQRRLYRSTFPGLDSSYYQAGTPRLRDTPFAFSGSDSFARALTVPSESQAFVERYGDHPGRMQRNEAEAHAQAAGRDPRNLSLEDDDFASRSVRRARDELRLPGVDWEATSRGLRGEASNKWLTTVTSVPEAGPDLGGFARGWSGPESENRMAYTVVPDVNSGRFAQKLTPRVIDQVYRKDIDSQGFAKDVSADLPLAGETKPVPPDRLASLSSRERIALLEKLAPGQRYGRNQSGYVWGTEYETPRYEYGASSKTGNPEVVVSEVRTPPELETKYLYTQSTRDPFVRYKMSPDVRSLGPSWGEDIKQVNWGGNLPPPPSVINIGPTSAGTAAGVPLNRQKRMTDGDISFRSDLIERRGGLSLADAQALQKKLGLPVTLPNINLPPEEALKHAIGSIAVHEGLDSHADVVNRYARALPRLGRTTAPRQPARSVSAAFPADVSPGIPSSVRAAFDLPRALSQAGFSPTYGGIDEANARIGDEAIRRVARVEKGVALGPLGGAALALTDPEAARQLGEAVNEPDPSQRGRRFLGAAGTYARNAAAGAGAGAAVSGALAAATRMGLGALASPAVTGMAVAAPVMAAAGVAQTADAYLEGATGRGLADHWRNTQDTASGMTRAQQAESPRKRYPEGWITVPGKGRRWRNGEGDYSLERPGAVRVAPAQTARQVIPQVFPTARAVPARTASGTARLTKTQPENPIIREARNRAGLFRERFNPLAGEFGVTELLLGR